MNANNINSDTKLLIEDRSTQSFLRVPVSNNVNKSSRKRIILKNGSINVVQPKSRRQQLAIFQFTSLVDSSWFFTLGIFLATLVSSWLVFAVLWWLICFSHGDFEYDHLPHNQKRSNFTPCVYDIHNFESCFLFSIETQHTVGYGVKATTDECPEAIFVNILQCIIGFIMQGFMAVIIFAKMTLPKLRSKTLLFSKFCTIHSTLSTDSSSKLVLEFRIGDMRKNHIIDATIRAFLVKSQQTLEGEILKNHQIELSLKSDRCFKNSLFFNWPLVVFHEITADSPLYNFCTSTHNNQFEIVLILEGTIQSTGQMTQARTSYTSGEIVWGKTFENLLSFNGDRREYEADFSKFDLLRDVSTPHRSAKDLDEPQNNNEKVNHS